VRLAGKMAKYITHMELVQNFADLHSSCGGYWEDRGYEWYPGILDASVSDTKRAGRWRAKWILSPGSPTVPSFELPTFGSSSCDSTRAGEKYAPA
jgi:DMSO/TMAO reductase YedYZ molybdopterin-dependent catalytic subunit